MFASIELDQIDAVDAAIWHGKVQHAVGLEYPMAFLKQPEGLSHMLQNISHENVVEGMIWISGVPKLPVTDIKSELASCELHRGSSKLNAAHGPIGAASDSINKETQATSDVEKPARSSVSQSLCG